MKIECPKCKQHLDVPEAYFGQSLGCPSCNVNLAIPFAMQPAAPEPVAAAVPAHAEEEAVVPAAPPPPPPPVPVPGQKKARPAKPAKSSKKKGTIIAVSVGGLLVVGAIVLIVIFGVPFLESKPAAKEVAWTFEADEGLFGKMSSGIETEPAIGVDGTIYATAMAGDVYAIDQTSGKKKWEYKVGKPYVSSPVVDDSGTVYVAAKGLFAFNGTTGAKLWDNSSGGSFSFGKYSTAPVIVPGGLLVSLYEDLSEDENSLRAFDSKNGDQKWTFELEESGGFGDEASTPAVASDGTIYLGRGSVFLALDGKTGKKKWDFETGRGILSSSIESSPAIGEDGTVYFGAADGKVYALNGKTGDKIWDRKVDSSVNGSPAIGPNGLVVISYGSGIVALDGKSGEEKWNHSLGAFSFTDYDGDPVVGNNGRVYIGSAGMSQGEKISHGLVVFDGNSGAKLWTISTGEGGWVKSGVKGGITMSSNGTVFFGGLDNKLYCVGTEATGPADSSWPMLGGNAQNTGNVAK